MSQLAPGKMKWVSAGKKESALSVGRGHAELLRFDFKSKPVEGDRKETTHAHPKE